MNRLLAIFFGVLIALITGALLFPFVSIIFDKHFHLFISNPKDDFIIDFSVTTWIFISAFCGGFGTVIFSHEPNRHNFIITALILALFPSLFLALNMKEFDWQFLLCFLIFIPAWLGGVFAGIL